MFRLTVFSFALFITFGSKELRFSLADEVKAEDKRKTKLS